MLRSIWYHLYNLKDMKNTHGGVLLLVKMQALACNFTKSNTPPWMFLRFLNCTIGTKSRKASHIIFDPSLRQPCYLFVEISENLWWHCLCSVVPFPSNEFF